VFRTSNQQHGDGRVFRVWRRLLGLGDKTVLEDVEHDELTDVMVAHVRPKSRWTRAARTLWPAFASVRPR
jgi:hypothetical protein